MCGLRAAAAMAQTPLLSFTLLSKDLLRLDFLLVSIRAREYSERVEVIMLGICFIWNFCIGFKQIDRDLPTRRVGQFCRFEHWRECRSSSFQGSRDLPTQPLPSLKVPLLSGRTLRPLTGLKIHSSLRFCSSCNWVLSLTSSVCPLSEENMGFFKFAKSPASLSSHSLLYIADRSSLKKLMAHIQEPLGISPYSYFPALLNHWTLHQLVDHSHLYPISVM